jgi:methylaspartate mutase sigma subunit
MAERPVAGPSRNGAAPTVILGVAASDAHAVANKLIDMSLTQAGYRVINLGPCTPVADFVACFAAHPHALAVAIGSLNGHAVEDLAPLREAKDRGLLGCPVIIGGNLSVGGTGRDAAAAALREFGADYVLDDAAQLVALLGQLAASRAQAAAAEPTLGPVA